MAPVPPHDWRPRGIEDLEPNAWKALRHDGSVCVVAGPGAGKTEFLAQRAVYLLETATCPRPYRVLAISFKKDAAANLAARVRQRCPPELANRFVSRTFDAFTKGLVDRFLTTIPAEWRPTRPYEVSFPKRREVKVFLDTTLHSASSRRDWQHEIVALSDQYFESHQIGAWRLPLTRTAPQSGTEYAITRWWHQQLRSSERSVLTFVSINRLAELLLRTNTHICRALRATYPFVFVDEFQDTTYAQYDFLLSAFAGGGGRTKVTAVGDDKQRIMGWAGARTDGFECFRADFGAIRIPLRYNFRSSPDLVRIQHVVARALDKNATSTVARTTRDVDGDVVQVWKSSTTEAEAQHLARCLVGDMERRGTAPRDYALLVRQKPDNFERELAVPLASAGLRLRNESHSIGQTTLQDLLTEEITHLVVAALRLGTERRAPAAWLIVSAAMRILRGVDADDEGALYKAESELTDFLSGLRVTMDATLPTHKSALSLAHRIFSFFDLAAIRRTYPQYETGDLLAIMVESFGLHLAASTEDAANWSECLDAFEGVAQIPLMTVHKSKGLEYDTVIFVGLDDETWWSHKPGDLEGLATFFVALSRAKQRAIFTFCEARGGRRRVADLYELLRTGGVPEINLVAPATLPTAMKGDVPF